MGFKVERRRAQITFAGTEYDGAEINCILDVSLKQWRAFLDIKEPEEEADEWIRLAEPTWNLEDEAGEPMPVTVDGLLSLPVALKNTIIRAWIEQAANPAIPLGQRSLNGAVTVDSVA